jgi:hypothetical protein
MKDLQSIVAQNDAAVAEHWERRGLYAGRNGLNYGPPGIVGSLEYTSYTRGFDRGDIARKRAVEVENSLGE